MTDGDKILLQIELRDAHEAMVKEDADRRAITRLQIEAWEAKGGREAEQAHINWLRTQPLRRTV